MRKHSFERIESRNEVLLDYLRIIEINRAHCGPRGLALFAVLGRTKNGCGPRHCFT
jgi:hypothetical protein